MNDIQIKRAKDSTNMKIKVTVQSAWVGPQEHYFYDYDIAEEFALAIRECQYKTTVEEVEED